MDVGFSTKKRLVLRTLTPSDSTSSTCEMIVGYQDVGAA